MSKRMDKVTDFSKSQFQTLFAYTFQTSLHLMDCAARLGEADLQDNPGYGQGSIHALLFHLLRAGWSWRIGLETGKRPQPFQSEDYPTLASLRAGFEREQAAWGALLDTLSPDEIAGSLSITNLRGEVSEMVRWRILMHVTLHGMQHHAEIAELLTRKGQSPGNIDFIFFR
jgi:uncharacterized damage-inducible protein DinB